MTDFHQLPPEIKNPACDLMHITGCTEEEALQFARAGISVDKSVEIYRKWKETQSYGLSGLEISLSTLLTMYVSSHSKIINVELTPVVMETILPFRNWKSDKLKRKEWKHRINNLMKSNK